MGKIWKFGIAVDQLIADTVDLNDEEFGKYVRILCNAWKQKARLPLDIERINQIPKNPNMKTTKYLLDRYFDKDNNGYTCKAQVDEWERVQRISNSNTENVNARWNKENIIQTNYDRNTSNSKSNSKSKSNNINYSNIMESWNKVIPTSHIQQMNDTRKNLFKSRFKPYFKGSYEEWNNFLIKISNISFLWGSNDRQWKADFNWVLNENNLLKILEGKYESDKIESLSSTDSIYETRLRSLRDDKITPFLKDYALKHEPDVRDAVHKKDITKERAEELGIKIG